MLTLETGYLLHLQWTNVFGFFSAARISVSAETVLLNMEVRPSVQQSVNMTGWVITPALHLFTQKFKLGSTQAWPWFFQKRAWPWCGWAWFSFIHFWSKLQEAKATNSTRPTDGTCIMFPAPNVASCCCSVEKTFYGLCHCAVYNHLTVWTTLVASLSYVSTANLQAKPMQEHQPQQSAEIAEECQMPSAIPR